MLLFIIRNELPQVAGTNAVCSSPEEKPFLQSAFNWCRIQKQNNHTARLLRISVVGFFFWIYWHSSFSNNVIIFIVTMAYHSVQISRSVVSDSLRPHESQHARPPCPSPTSGVHSNSCLSSRWCHPAISSSVVPSPSAPDPSQHESLFQWVNSSYEVAKVLEFQL